MDIKIKEEYKSTAVGYNGSALPLGKRDINDLVYLAEIAHNSGSESIKKYFEILPTKEEIQEYKGQKFIEKIKVTNGCTKKRK